MAELLTKKKKKWVGQFKPTVTMKGTPLTHNAVGAATYNRKLQRLVDRMTEETEKAIKSLFASEAAEAHFGEDANIASSARIVTNKLQKRFDRLFGYHSKPMAEAMTREANRQSSASLHTSLKELSGGLSMNTTLMNGPLATVISASVAENVALIKSIPEQYLNAIQGATMRSITTGNGLKDLLPFIQKHKMITKRRAKMISYDQTRKAYSSINRERMTSVGIRKFKWVHSGGSNDPRKYHMDKWPAGLNGGIFSLEDPPVIDQKTGERGIPGQCVNCVPGSSNVKIPYGLNKMYRRRYTGELFSLVTNDGKVFKATGNHPILTDAGWKPVKLVNVGDYIVEASQQCGNGAEPNTENPESRIGDFFEAALSSFGKECASTMITQFQFHGDVSDDEVDVIDIDGFLPDEIDPDFSERICEFLLAWSEANLPKPGGFVDRSSDELVMGYLGAPPRFISGLGALLSELRASFAGCDQRRHRCISDLNAHFYKPEPDCIPGDSVLFGKLKLADTSGIFSGDLLAREILALFGRALGNRRGIATGAEELGKIIGVAAKNPGNLGITSVCFEKLHRVIEKRVIEFSEHVYNLETVGNWYVSNGIITHNCACTMTPVIEFEDGTESA